MGGKTAYMSGATLYGEMWDIQLTPFFAFRYIQPAKRCKALMMFFQWLIAEQILSQYF